MKSRIPHSKSIQNSSQGSRDDLLTVYESFTRIGAPISAIDEFRRLYRGPFGDVLGFASEHLKGRQEVALSRNKIHLLREVRTQSNIKQPDDITRSVVDRATSSLSAATKTLDTYRKQLDHQQMEIETSQWELEKLERQLEDRRRVKLMLSLLEQKERSRIQRFKEMTKLIAKSSNATAQLKRLKEIVPHSQARIPRNIRFCHTRDTLASLHAHHVRISNFAGRPDNGYSDIRTRLKIVIEKRSDASRSKQEIENIIEKCFSAARKRAKQKMRYKSRDHSLTSKRDLESQLQINKSKEKMLQRLSNLSIAMILMSQHFNKSIATFREKTSLVIRSSLEEEALLTKDYLDLLRCLIATGFADVPERRNFVRDAGRVLGLRGHVSVNSTVTETKHLVKDLQEKNHFLHTATVTPPALEHGEIIASFQNNTQSAQARALKLLGRKAEKADLGSSVVEDVENLLRESQTIVGRD